MLAKRYPLKLKAVGLICVVVTILMASGNLLLAQNLYGTNSGHVRTSSGALQSTIITFDEQRYRDIVGQRLYNGGPNTLIDNEAGLDFFVAYGEMYITRFSTDYMMFFSPLGASGWDPVGRIVITFNELQQYVRIDVSSDFTPVHTPAYLRVAFYKNTTPSNPLYYKDGGGNIEYTDTADGIKMLIVDTHFAENNIEELEFIGLGASTLPAPSGVTALENYDSMVPIAWQAPTGGPFSMSSSALDQEMSNKKIVIGDPAKMAATAAALQGYNIYRSNSETGSYSKIKSNETKLYYVDASVSNGQMYFYKVTAVYDIGESEFSNIDSAQPKANGNYIASGWASTAPTLNGVINSTEWAAAAKTNIPFPGQTGTVTLYVMNDNSRLYLGIDNQLDNNSADYDGIGVFCDENSNKAWPASGPSGEGLIQIYQESGSQINRYLGFFGTWPDQYGTDSYTTPSGVNQMLSFSSGHMQIETSFDLLWSPFNASPGDNIGLLIYVLDATNGEFDGLWPQQTYQLEPIAGGNTWAHGPFSYGKVKLASLASEPDISADPSSWNYGSVIVGSSSSKTFVIKNDGTANLNVTATSINVSEFSIQSGGGAFTLTPGATRDIVVRFSPTSGGSKAGALSISSNDPDENPFTIALSGSGTAVAGIPINPVTTSPQMAGVEFWVNIDVGTNATPVTDLFGISFNLNYSNTNYINYVSSEAGSFIGSGVLFYPTPDDANGKVSIGISRMAPQIGVNGFGTVARVKLIAIPATPNNTPIQFSISNVTANNSVGTTIPLVPGSLNITIQSGLIVWPGDTNNNGTVDQADILPLGLYWGKTGPTRQNASMTWSGQLAMFWSPQAATYADANGDGSVSQADVLPIGLNWTKTHTTALAKPGVAVAQANKSTATNLTISITGDTNPGKDFFINIFVNNVTNLFGLSFELIYTPTAFVDPLTAELGIDNLMGTDLIYFPMINKNAGIDTGKVAVGISRKSGQGGVTGTGLVTLIKAHMAAAALSGASATRLSLQNIMANDPGGNPIAIDTCFFKLITGGAVANVSGAVKYCQNSSPVENATITIDGHTTTTGTNGSFSFKSIPGGNLTLTPSKTGDLGSSISAYDASIVLRYSVGLIMLTPYQSIAADVSGNGSISAYDASVILRYTVGLISSFPVDADWKFVPNSFAINASNWNTAPGSIMYSPLNSDQTNQDFTGIVYGDVSGNWTQLNLEKSYNGNTTVKFGDVVCVSSNEFIVPIETNVSGQMFSAKIEVQFEDDVINFQEVLLSEKLKDYAECHNVQAGHLTIALAGTGDIELEKDFISIKFIARNAEEKQPGTVKIVDAMVNEEQIAVDFRNGNISLNHTLPSTHQLEQNYPNPFNLATTIAFQLSRPAKAQLSIYDVQGREIRTLLHETKNAGHYSVDWDGRDEAGNCVASGMYFYKLWTNQFSVMKKCLLIK